MKGCNHWVGGGQPRGLIPPWRPCVDDGPTPSSIGACHNIGSCGQLISAGTVKLAIRCLSPILQRLVRPRMD